MGGSLVRLAGYYINMLGASVLGLGVDGSRRCVRVGDFIMIGPGFPIVAGRDTLGTITVTRRRVGQGTVRILSSILSG